MALSDDRTRGFVRKLLMSRMRVLARNGFYGLLLMHMAFALDSGCAGASTDGQRIVFNPDFLDGLHESELDFVLMHEVLHAALRHCERRGERDAELFDVACDIVVNSNILRSCGMREEAIAVHGEVGPHRAPDGTEGFEHTAEQVYEMLARGSLRPVPGSPRSGRVCDRAQGEWDDHSLWEDGAEVAGADDGLWAKRLEDACKSIAIRDPTGTCGLLPAFAERMLADAGKPKVDWRCVLDEFVQEDVADYSFTPPDRRFGDSDFFLPDFNAPDERPRDVLFMVDASGSMSDDMVTMAFEEVKSAISQFGGKLQGWLGFFDAAVSEPIAFENADDLVDITLKGGGGTSFHAIFDYVRNHMAECPPASIVVLTDGFAPFPPEQAAAGTPVLWLLTSSNITPPWGKVARMV